jgi:hypothetical protein
MIFQGDVHPSKATDVAISRLDPILPADLYITVWHPIQRETGERESSATNRKHRRHMRLLTRLEGVELRLGTREEHRVTSILDTSDRHEPTVSAKAGHLDGDVRHGLRSRLDHQPRERSAMAVGTVHL